MSKKEENINSPEKDFNLLNMNPSESPFGDDLEMQFKDEFVESAIIAKVPNADDHTKDTTEIVEDTKKVEAPKKTEAKKTEEPTKEVEEPELDAPNTEAGEPAEENGISAFYSWATDQGLVESIEEGKKVETEDDLKEVISTTIKKGIEEYKTSHPEEVQHFIDFVDNGGNPRDFHKLYYEQRSWRDIDTKSEENQELIVRAAYKESGWDEEDINSQVSDLKDLGKLEALSEKLHKKLIAGEDEDKKTMLEAQKEYQARQAAEAKKQWDDFKENIYKKEEVQGFKLTPKVKDDLWNFMTKVDKKTGKTPLQVHNETNTDAQVLYAYLAMNNWDISKLEKQVKTKVTSELSKKLKNVTDTRSKISGGSSDGFASEKGKNNFSAFKSIVNKI